MNDFNDLTRSRYNAMKARVSERRNKRGRILQVGREPEYNLQQYRDWVLAVLGGFEGGVCRCRYCDRPIALETLVTDHMQPISRGGELTIGNLAPCCGPCNDAKGRLTEYEFKSLCTALNEIGFLARDDVLNRLAKSEKLAGSHRRMMAMMHKGKGTTEDHPRPSVYAGETQDEPPF